MVLYSEASIRGASPSIGGGRSRSRSMTPLYDDQRQAGKASPRGKRTGNTARNKRTFKQNQYNCYAHYPDPQSI